MSVLSKTLGGILGRESGSRTVQKALTSGKVARVKGDDGKRYLVFAGEAAQHVRLRPKK